MFSMYQNNRREPIFVGLNKVEIENIMALVHRHLYEKSSFGVWPTSKDVKNFVLEDGPEMQAIRKPWEDARREGDEKQRKDAAAEIQEKARSRRGNAGA